MRYVQDGAASPMETMLAMMLCLPYGLGGYGLEKPLINHRVDVPSSSKRLADRAYCVCDLCWPEAKLCVEYDSARYHVDPDRQDSDARRRSTLIALGYTVVTVTRGQVMDAGAFNRLAHQLAKQTGKTASVQRPGFHAQAPRIAVGVVADIRTQGGCAMSVLFEEMEIGSLRDEKPTGASSHLRGVSR